MPNLSYVKFITTRAPTFFGYIISVLASVNIASWSNFTCIFFSDAREFSASIAKNGNITFENVCFEYVQGKKILDQLSFTVPAGKRVAVVGGSGSGKSTLIRLLYRFFEPNNGAVKIGDENICDIDVECLRKEIAVVPQDSVLFHNTIKHNINYGNLNANEDDVISAAKMAEIHDSIQVKHKL